MRNLRGRGYQVYDAAGVMTNERFDFKGNLRRASRRLAREYRAAVDWSDLAEIHAPDAVESAAERLLEREAFTTKSEYDALNRVVSHVTPDGSDARSRYDEAGRLVHLSVAVRGAPATIFLESTEYNARGQRTRVVHGNGVICTHTYDPTTFRVVHLRTRRADARLQSLRYEYDAVGNLVEIRDGISFGNPDVSANARYEYDPLYRLTRATGREHPGQQPSFPDAEPLNLGHPDDLSRLVRYRESFTYDPVGNILEIAHDAEHPAGRWRRRYEYDAESNRLLRTGGPRPDDRRDSAHYAHDACGNMTSMPHLSEMRWDHASRLVAVDRAGGGLAYFANDGKGDRVRKVYEHSGIIEERIYLGAYEVYRRRAAGDLEIGFERETIHVMNGDRRLALVETNTVDESAAVSRARYQLDDHLASSVMEIDAEGGVISYEEYSPFGATSLQAMRAAPSAKRYRYTGQERDEETSLYAQGARHYAPWLGRWTSPDPAGTVDGTNLFAYCKNRPTSLTDPRGTDCDVAEWGSMCQEGPDPMAVGLLGAVQQETGQEMHFREDGQVTLGSYENNPTDTVSYHTDDPVPGDVGEPGFFESLIPIWGSGRAAIHHFQAGHYVRGAIYTALAISDVFLVKSIITAVGKVGAAAFLKGGVAKVAGEEAATNIMRESATVATEGTTETVVHLTNPAAADAINASGKFGGKWGGFVLDAERVPSSAAGRFGKTLVLGDLSAEVRLTGEGTRVFGRPPTFGPFSTLRNAMGIRSSPLGSFVLESGRFIPGEIFKGGVFRSATIGEYAMQVSHQWLLDYGVDALIYSGGKMGAWSYDVGDDPSGANLGFSPLFPGAR
jgi:RHS repeat-associated protein